jgi:hypothetical protein
VEVDVFIGVDECRLAKAEWRMFGKGEGEEAAEGEGRERDTEGREGFIY